MPRLRTSMGRRHACCAPGVTEQHAMGKAAHLTNRGSGTSSRRAPECELSVASVVGGAHQMVLHRGALLECQPTATHKRPANAWMDSGVRLWACCCPNDLRLGKGLGAGIRSDGQAECGTCLLPTRRREPREGEKTCGCASSVRAACGSAGCGSGHARVATRSQHVCSVG